MVNGLKETGVIQILIMNSEAEIAAATNYPDKKLFYYKMKEEDKEPQKIITPVVTCV